VPGTTDSKKKLGQNERLDGCPEVDVRESMAGAGVAIRWVLRVGLLFDGCPGVAFFGFDGCPDLMGTRSAGMPAGGAD